MHQYFMSSGFGPCPRYFWYFLDCLMKTLCCWVKHTVHFVSALLYFSMNLRYTDNESCFHLLISSLNKNLNHNYRFSDSISLIQTEFFKNLKCLLVERRSSKVTKQRPFLQNISDSGSAASGKSCS